MGRRPMFLQLCLTPALEDQQSFAGTAIKLHHQGALLLHTPVAPQEELLEIANWKTGQDALQWKIRRKKDDCSKRSNCDVSPEEAVAHGTAIQAAILTDRKKIAVGATEAALHEGAER